VPSDGCTHAQLLADVFGLDGCSKRGVASKRAAGACTQLQAYVRAAERHQVAVVGARELV
jgi:hypothetical protein